ncbi:hypothetical protein [Acetobacter malorum]|uniref:hypothetical protein n=1 Tax=Acetobacter malorum TaxID=178901 RepID=UPI00077773EE|nr:hypothetical protein [Acetobacter malorum]KXV08187.1 hypothetical protein AD930_04205 [Acetobacter malorum]
MVFPAYIHIEKIWKIPLSYIGHCTGFSALKGSCTATAKRDVFQGVPQIIPDASFWFGKEGLERKYGILDFYILRFLF